MKCKILTKYEAINIAKNNAAKYRLSWSDKNLYVKEGELNGIECFVVSTLDNGTDESESWLNFQFTNPMDFYVSRADGTFLGYGIANREIITIHKD